MIASSSDALLQSRGTILCVEDEADLLDDLACELREAGYTVIEVRNGATALSLLETALNTGTTVIDLVLCDMQLPGMSGLDVLRSLRQRPDLRLPPFILATAYSDAGIQSEAEALCVSRLIVKPIDYDALLASIPALLQSGKYP